MNQAIEAHGPSVDEAITSGLSKLGVNKEDVDIEVIDEGRRAILGIGGRDAVVRLTRVSSKDASAKVEMPSAPVDEVMAMADEEAPPVVEEAKVAVKADDFVEEPSDALPLSAEIETAVSVVTELIDLMQVEANISSNVTEPDDLTGKRLPIVNINGDDLGVLIGPRGETLDALQYISRLMVGHRIQQRANFVIDIEGYRERREQALSRLAERMASKAVKRGSPVTLEPMPAYERRIIHMTLRDSAEVRTESTGEGNRRRVRIYPL